MEVLNLSGYTEEEKVQIAERFLVPKQWLSHGLRTGEITRRRAETGAGAGLHVPEHRVAVATPR